MSNFLPRSISEHVPCDVGEAVIRRGVEDPAEPRMRVERQDVHVTMRSGKSRGVTLKRRVVVHDVLSVQRGDVRPNMVGGPVKRRDIDEKIRSSKVVLVRIFLDNLVRLSWNNDRTLRTLQPP